MPQRGARRVCANPTPVWSCRPEKGCIHRCLRTKTVPKHSRQHGVYTYKEVCVTGASPPRRSTVRRFHSQVQGITFIPKIPTALKETFVSRAGRTILSVFFVVIALAILSACGGGTKSSSSP